MKHLPSHALASLLGLCLLTAASRAQDTVFAAFGNTSAGSNFDVRAAALQQPMRLLGKTDGILPYGLQFDWCGRDMTTSTGLSPQIGLNYSQQGVTTSTVSFAPGEFIRRVDVWAIATRINMVRIYTPTTSYDFGSRQTNDTRHNFPAPTNEQVVGFVGTGTNSAIYSLGVVTRPLLASDQSFGTGCTTHLGQLQLNWRSAGAGMVIGSTPIIECPNVPTNSLCWYLYGFTDASYAGVPLPFDLAPYGSPGCYVYQSIDFNVFGLPDPNNVWAHTIDARSWSPTLAGTNIFLQALILNPNGVFKTSDSLKTAIGIL